MNSVNTGGESQVLVEELKVRIDELERQNEILDERVWELERETTRLCIVIEDLEVKNKILDKMLEQHQNLKLGVVSSNGSITEWVKRTAKQARQAAKEIQG